MAKWLLVMSTDCNDPSRENEFNDWYDKIHLPDILETPGFVKATRYENTDPSVSTGKFLAVYEIETENIDKTMAALQENLNKKRQQGRRSELVVVVSRAAYRQISSLVRQV